MKKIGDVLKKMSSLNKLLIFLFLYLVSVTIEAQVAVQAEISSNQVGLNAPFTLEINVSTTKQVEIDEPTNPTLENFTVHAGSQRTQISTRMQSGANGMEYVTQRIKTFSYQLVAQKLGRLIITPFVIKIDGKEYKTSPIDIEVLKTVNQQQQRNNNRNQPSQSPFEDDENDPFAQMDRMEEELFNQLLQRKGLKPNIQPRGGQNPNNPFEDEQINGGYTQPKEPAFRSTPQNPNEAFFIQVEVDKKEVYEGEQIVVSWYLLTRGQIETLDRTKFPDLRGFWKEIIEEVPSIQFYQEVINGVPYKKALLARHALFPLKAGDSVIDEFKIKSKVRMPSQGFGFGMGNAYEYTKSSLPVKIKVKPIPSEGRPADFSGAVGKFKMRSNIEGEQPVAHQPMRLKLRIEGQGNVKGLELPSITWPDGVEVFEVKNETKFLKSGQSYKEFDIILIPRKEGAVVIPVINSSFFNPETGKFYSEKTTEIPLQILPGSAVDNNQSALRMDTTTGKSGMTNKKESIPAIIADYDNYKPNVLAQIWNGKWNQLFWITIYSFVLLFLTVFSFKKLGWVKNNFDPKKEFHKRIAIIEKKMNSKKENTRETYIEITNLFNFVLGSISGEGGGTQEFDKLIEKIPVSVRKNYGEDLKKLFNFFQTLGFAPIELTQKIEQEQAKDIKNNFEKAKSILSKALSESSQS